MDFDMYDEKETSGCGQDARKQKSEAGNGDRAEESVTMVAELRKTVEFELAGQKNLGACGHPRPPPCSAADSRPIFLLEPSHCIRVKQLLLAGRSENHRTPCSAPTSVVWHLSHSSRMP